MRCRSPGHKIRTLWALRWEKMPAYPGFPGGEKAGGTAWKPLPPGFPQQLVFVVSLLQNANGRSGEGGGGSSCSQERRRTLLRPGRAGLSAGFVPCLPRPFVLTPALPRTWSPVKFLAAPGNTCRETGSSAGPLVTIETAANGSPALPAGAGPKEAGANGRGATASEN